MRVTLYPYLDKIVMSIGENGKLCFKWLLNIKNTSRVNRGYFNSNVTYVRE